MWLIRPVAISLVALALTGSAVRTLPPVLIEDAFAFRSLYEHKAAMAVATVDVGRCPVFADQITAVELNPLHAVPLRVIRLRAS